MNFSKRRQPSVGGAKNKSKQFSVALNTFYSTHRRLDWHPYSFGHPNIDFSAAPIYFVAPNATFGGVEYFPSSQHRQYSAVPIISWRHGGVEHFPSSPRRVCLRHHPKTAPRQLQSKSGFFAPCISQKVSQWRQRRHVKIYKKLFKDGPHQKRNSSLCNMRHTLFIHHTKPDTEKKSTIFYCLWRRRTFFNVCTAFGGAKPGFLFL